jgi:hypothetical protein
MANDQQSLILGRCQKCNAKLVVQRPSGETVIFGRAIIVRNGITFSICHDCKYENPIDCLAYRATRLIVSENEENLHLTSEKPPATLLISEADSQSHRDAMT